MRSLARALVAVLAGAVIACVVTAFVLYARFAYGGYAPEALIELPLWALGVIAGCGGLLGLSAGLLADRVLLPGWSRPAVMGGLAGVAVVVAVTLFVAHSFGGPSSKTQDAYLHVGLVYGVPIGLVVGAAAGLIVAKWHSARLGAVTNQTPKT